MITSQISLLALILVGGIGILLIGVSALMKAAARKKAKACTAVTMGTVIDHRFMGEGRMYPVLNTPSTARNTARKNNSVA